MSNIEYAKAQQEKFKALFMYNFTKNIDWPAQYYKGDFVIGILGNTPLSRELKTIAQTKKIGGQKLVVKNYSNVSQIENCHIIYIPTYKSKYLEQVILKIKGKSVLIITDNEGLALEGAGINYIMDGNKIKFEINSQNIENNGLKVSSSLIKLGIPVK